jgi:hypothetical protein
MTAREQAREAAKDATRNTNWADTIGLAANAASDVWEPIVRSLYEALTHAGLPALDRLADAHTAAEEMAREALGIVPPASSLACVVIRFEDGYPDEWKPEGMDGLWLNRPPTDTFATISGNTPKGVAYATGRVERRDDGAYAEVYEVRR